MYAPEEVLGPLTWKAPLCSLRGDLFRTLSFISPPLRIFSPASHPHPSITFLASPVADNSPADQRNVGEENTSRLCLHMRM